MRPALDLNAAREIRDDSKTVWRISGDGGYKWDDGNDRTWRVSVTWTEVDGRMEPTAVHVTAEGFALTSTAMRRIPVGDLFAQIRRVVLAAASGFQNSDDPMKRLAGERLARAHGPRGGVAFTDDDLRHVAKVYEEAWKAGQPVTAAVAATFNIAASTASKRIMAARKRGFIPTTRQDRR